MSSLTNIVDCESLALVLMKQMANVVMLVLHTGQIRYLNARGKNILGLRPQPKPVFFQNIFLEENAWEQLQLVAGPTVRWKKMELTMLDGEKKRRLFELEPTCIQGKNGNPLYLVSCCEMTDKVLVDVSIATSSLLNELNNSLRIIDPETYKHQLRVARYISEMCGIMGFETKLTKEMMLGASVHDIGKVENDIYRSGREFTAEEKEQSKRHPDVGAQLLSGLLVRHPQALLVVKQHHEKNDGSGYPDELFGGQISVGGQISAVADSLDAMITRNGYKKKKSIERAMAELKELSGSWYDSAAVNAIHAVYKDKPWIFSATG